MARAASTIPGSVATLHSCSSQPSSPIASTSSASAKTRAGTRMSARASAGTSQVTSSTRRSSDIEDHRRAPAGLASLERQPVVGHRLDQVRRPPAPRHELPAHHAFPDAHAARLLRDKEVLLSQEDQLLKPGGQQRARIAALDLQLARDRLVVRLPEHVAERRRGLGHRVLGARRLNAQLQLARVLDPLAHPRSTYPERRRRRVDRERSRAEIRNCAAQLPAARTPDRRSASRVTSGPSPHAAEAPAPAIARSSPTRSCSWRSRPPAFVTSSRRPPSRPAWSTRASPPRSWSSSPPSPSRSPCSPT